MGRVIVWFSCGAASAVAAKLAVEKYGKDNVHLVYCDTLITEHPDNIRFLRDVEQWTGLSVEIIRSQVFASIDEVFMFTRYMAGIKGARCTVEMKKVPRFDYQQPDDVHIFGLTADEGKRIAKFIANNPELNLEWILRENGVTKDDCYRRIKEAGITLPAMYALGFKNNNCIGCVKATSAVYWANVRKHFPEVYARRARQSRELGVRLVRYHGKRIFLDELPAVITDLRKEEDIECGPVCLNPNAEELAAAEAEEKAEAVSPLRQPDVTL